MTFIYVLLSFLAGICFAVQGPTNSALGKRTNRIQAALVSFGGGVLVMAILVLAAGSGNLANIRNAQIWKLLGGVYGAYGVVVTIVAMPELGLALTLTIIMLGQLLMGAVIDATGIFETVKVPVSLLRIAGIAAVLAGICIVYLARKEQGKKADKDKAPLMAVLALVSGILGAIQSPTNAALSRIVGRFESTLVSFTGGFIASFIVFIIIYRGRTVPMNDKGIRPWMLIGGIYGSAGVFINVLCTPVLGVALLVVSGMVGQLSGGLAVDTLGLLDTKKIPLDKKRAVGIIIIALGMMVVSIAKSIS